MTPMLAMPKVIASSQNADVRSASRGVHRTSSLTVLPRGAACALATLFGRLVGVESPSGCNPMLLASLTYYPLYSALGTYADPKSLNFWMSVFIVVILVNYVGMTYGPIGAFLAEFFPSRIRYTSVSVPYHIGNGWGGGLVPIVTTAAYAKAVENGSSDPLFWALVYPIAIPAIMRRSSRSLNASFGRSHYRARSSMKGSPSILRRS